MAKNCYIFGNREFATKKSATEAIRDIFRRNPNGVRVNHDDSAFLTDVLARHPDALQKIGCGIDSFSVERNGPTRGFWIHRVDGSATDFSYVACLTPPTAEANARKAFRLEIRPQIVAFRDEAFQGKGLVPCAVTGELLTIDECNVDHFDPTFAELTDRFVLDCGISIGDVAVNPTADGSTITMLTDRVLAAKWYAYHHKHARLRVLSKKANLGLPRPVGPKVVDPHALVSTTTEQTCRSDELPFTEIDKRTTW